MECGRQTEQKDGSAGYERNFGGVRPHRVHSDDHHSRDHRHSHHSSAHSPLGIEGGHHFRHIFVGGCFQRHLDLQVLAQSTGGWVPQHSPGPCCCCRSSAMIARRRRRWQWEADQIGIGIDIGRRCSRSILSFRSWKKIVEKRILFPSVLLCCWSCFRNLTCSSPASSSSSLPSTNQREASVPRSLNSHFFEKLPPKVARNFQRFYQKLSKLLYNDIYANIFNFIFLYFSVFSHRYKGSVKVSTDRVATRPFQPEP